MWWKRTGMLSQPLCCSQLSFDFYSSHWGYSHCLEKTLQWSWSIMLWQVPQCQGRDTRYRAAGSGCTNCTGSTTESELSKEFTVPLKRLSHTQTGFPWSHQIQGFQGAPCFVQEVLRWQKHNKKLNLKNEKSNLPFAMAIYIKTNIFALLFHLSFSI